MGEKNRHIPGEMEGGQNLFITFCVDAKSSERPCSAEQRRTLNDLNLSKQIFLPLSFHVGCDRVNSNSALNLSLNVSC